MATGRQSDDFYTRVLEYTGFYRKGSPLAGAVWSSEELNSAAQSSAARPFEQIDRHFKYQAILQSENKKGKIGVSDVFELSQSPCIYFKRWDADPPAAELTRQLLDWQQVAWNDGRAPMLWVVTPTHVRILNAYARPREGHSEAALKRVEILRFENLADGLEKLRQFAAREQIQSGRFWGRAEAEPIDRQKRVDRQLIADLGNAAEQLGAKGLDLAEAHRLLLRGIFAKYLQAHGWLSREFLQKNFGVPQFNDALASETTAGKMFDWLAETFNGDVFPHLPEAGKYTTSQLAELRLILDGGDPKTRQRYLWPYDFGVIPIELLSSIYESFSHALDRHAAEARSVHYTPINLVELTLSEVFDDESFGHALPTNAKVADLACGSGVFLVQLLRRLVARRIAAGERRTRDLIRDTLYNQIFGVDVLGGALHIAAISLYLAALELDPSPGVGNGVKFKPLIYPCDEKARRARHFFNLYEADTFDTEADFNRQAPFAQKREGEQLSVVVGNPPWTRPAGVRSEKTEGDAVETPLHLQYARKRGIRLPNQDPPDQLFMWRAADFAVSGARLGFILSGRRFFSHDEDSVAAKRDLLTRFAPSVMINLGQLRLEHVFPTATHPGMILIAQNRSAEPGIDCTYASVERSLTFKRHGTLELGPESIKRLSVRRASQDEDFLKIASWGSARDAALIAHLKQFPTLEKFFERRSVRPRHGFIRGNEKNPVPKEIVDRPCLETEGLVAFGMTAAGLALTGTRQMERTRKPAIYRGPLFLLALGLSDNALTSAICADSLVYSQRYLGVSLPKDEPNEWAAYLNGIINSSLATYFVFLTAAEWGVERDNVNGADLRRLPVPEMSADQSPFVRRLLDVEGKLRELALQGEAISKQKRRNLDAVVFDLYRLDPDQRIHVEDALAATIDFQRNLDQSQCFQKPDSKHLALYAQSFIAVVNEFLSVRNERKATAEVFELPTDCPLQVVKFTVTPRSSALEDIRPVARQELGPLLDRIAKGLPSEAAADVYTRRYVRFYGPNEVYLIKPAQIRFWTRSAGMSDADAVLAEHLGSAT